MSVPARKVRRAAAVAALGVAFLGSMAGEAHGSPGWSWPIEGEVTTRYANDDANAYAGGMHRGIDVAAAVGTEVRAAREGEVTFAGAVGYSGLTVAVRTVDGYVTSYLHLGALAVRRGERVGAGARIGEVGTTGRRSQPEPHLHFGVRIAAEEHRYVDPLTLLPPLPVTHAPAPPEPAPSPAPAQPEPAPVRAVAAPVRARAVLRPAAGPVRAPVHLPLPAPAPRAAPAPARVTAPRPAPVAPRAVTRPQHVARARPAQMPSRSAVPQAQPATRDWGRPLALAGLGLLMLALFGRSALRAARDANGAASRRLYEALARAVRPARAYLPRWR